MCVCEVSAHIHVSVYAHVYTYGQVGRPEVNAGCLSGSFPTLFFETESLTKTGACPLV